MANAVPSRRMAPAEPKQYRNAERRYRGSASQRGYDDDWQRVAILRREMDEQLCQDCLAEGGIGQAIATLSSTSHAHEVDHIIPIHVRPDWRLEVQACRTRCSSHHAKKTHADSKHYGSAAQTEITRQQQFNREQAQRLTLQDIARMEARKVCGR